MNINKDILNEIYHLARNGFPNEVCGWLRGDPTNGNITSIRPAINVYNKKNHPVVNDRTAETAYVISPEDVLELNNELDKTFPPLVIYHSSTPVGDEAKIMVPLVIYHSHPNGKAYFSETDRVVATDPWGEGPNYPVQQLVIGVNKEEIVESRLFSWNSNRKDYIEISKYKGARI